MEVLQFLAAQPVVFTALALMFGCTVGSFLNVVCLRLPKMMEREWRQQCAELSGQPLDDSA